VSKAAILLQERRFQEAVIALETASDLDPWEPSIAVNLGIAHFGVGNGQAGLAAFERAVQLSPRDPEIHYKLGEIYRVMEEADRAMEAYRAALSYNLDHRLARKRVVELLLAQEDYIRAVVNTRIWLDGAPQDPQAYRYLGLGLQGRDRDREARQAFQKARQLYQEQRNAEGVREVDQLIEDLDE
jgi:Flp pilus assembly protein TadD